MKIGNTCQTQLNENSQKSPIAKYKSDSLKADYGLNSSACTCSFGRAQVNMQNWDKDITDVVSTLLEPDERLEGFYKQNGTTRLKITQPCRYEGINSKFYEAVKHVACHRDSEGNLESIYVLGDKTRETDVYNAGGTFKAHFDKEETKALKEYKYRPVPFHNLLRYERKTYGADWQEEVENNLTKLEGIFSDKNRLMQTKENRILYRALQDRLPDEDIRKLSTVGEIYEDKSFPSTSTDIEVAKRFSCGNPIMEIEFPEGSNYLDMDALFNIDHQHWREDEFLLDKNSRFLVTGHDSENNIVKVKYLP